MEDFREHLSQVSKAALAKRGRGCVDRKVIVFIDELDRCRPSYAIELLETVKHLFSVDNVAFVIATDSDQLQHAIRAVYGVGFDAEKYLQRFFHTSFVLPTPNHLDFSNTLIRESAVDPSYLVFGYFFQPPEKVDNELSHLLAFASAACNLNLRAMQQVWTRAEAAFLAHPGRVIDAVWLLCLLALQSYDRAILTEIQRAVREKRHALLDRFSTPFDARLVWPYTKDDDGAMNPASETYGVIQVVVEYIGAIQSAHHANARHASYPRTLKEEVAGRVLRQNETESTALPLEKHLDLVLLAGHLE